MKHQNSLFAILLCAILVLCLSFAGCGKTEEPIDSDPYESTADDSTANSLVVTLSEDPEDYSIYAGIWLCGAQYDYDYLKLDEAGNWELYVGNDVVESGHLKYEPAWECIYAYNDADGSGCQFRLEGEELYTSAYGYFTYADGMTDIRYSEDGTDPSFGTDAPVETEELHAADAPNPELYQQDIRNLAGTWYRTDAESDTVTGFFTLDESGTWELYAEEDEPNAFVCTDTGSLTYSADEASIYLAVSAETGNVYRVFEFDQDILVFGDDGTYTRGNE